MDINEQIVQLLNYQIYYVQMVHKHGQIEGVIVGYTQQNYDQSEQYQQQLKNEYYMSDMVEYTLSSESALVKQADEEMKKAMELNKLLDKYNSQINFWKNIGKRRMDDNEDATSWDEPQDYLTAAEEVECDMAYKKYYQTEIDQEEILQDVLLMRQEIVYRSLEKLKKQSNNLKRQYDQMATKLFNNHKREMEMIPYMDISIDEMRILMDGQIFDYSGKIANIKEGTIRKLKYLEGFVDGTKVQIELLNCKIKKYKDSVTESLYEIARIDEKYDKETIRKIELREKELYKDDESDQESTTSN